MFDKEEENSKRIVRKRKRISRHEDSKNNEEQSVDNKNEEETAFENNHSQETENSDPEVQSDNQNSDSESKLIVQQKNLIRVHTV